MGNMKELSCYGSRRFTRASIIAVDAVFEAMASKMAAHIEEIVMPTTVMTLNKHRALFCLRPLGADHG
jgi:hypothetical protein